MVSYFQDEKTYESKLGFAKGECWVFSIVNCKEDTIHLDI